MMRQIMHVLGSLVLMLTLMGSAIAANKEHVTEADYRLGVGDMVRVSVYGSPDMLTESRISASGAITFPLIGEVGLAGLSSAQAEKKVAEKLQQGGFLKNPQVNVVVVQYQSQVVSVLGDVYKPGKFTLEKVSSLAEVLALAGGITPNGSELITLIRQAGGQTTRYEYDFRDLIRNLDPQSNPLLQADDIVFVGAREVSILGRVNRPGKYTVISGVRTVTDFLSQAGGISPDGADKIIVMTKREGKTTTTEIDIDWLYKSGDASKNVELTEGDAIYVPRSPVFYIYGEVVRSGSYRLERNMNVAQALSVGGGLSLRGTERGIKIKRVVDGALKTLEVQANDIVQADDVIYVKESLF